MMAHTLILVLKKKNLAFKPSLVYTMSSKPARAIDNICQKELIILLLALVVQNLLWFPAIVLTICSL